VECGFTIFPKRIFTIYNLCVCIPATCPSHHLIILTISGKEQKLYGSLSMSFPIFCTIYGSHGDVSHHPFILTGWTEHVCKYLPSFRRVVISYSGPKSRYSNRVGATNLLGLTSQKTRVASNIPPSSFLTVLSP
jgi:hypothetical protein